MSRFLFLKLFRQCTKLSRTCMPNFQRCCSSKPAPANVFCSGTAASRFLSRGPSVCNFYDPLYYNHKANSNNCKKNYIFGGVMTFLGLSQKDETESELIMTIKKGILAMQRGEFKKSEQILHVALKLAQEQENSSAITYIYDLLANVAFEDHNLLKAEKLFVTVLQRIISTGTEENDNKTLHISLKLASIYKEKGDDLKAEEGFKFCKQHLEKKIDAGALDEDTLLLWAMTLDWYARFVLDKGRYEEAFTLFEKAFETNLRVNGTVHEQNVILLNDLGTVCCLQNNYDEAIKYLTQAVNICKELPDMEDAASVYINLGTVYLKKEMLSEAKNACREGWRNAKQMKNTEALQEANICLDQVRLKLAA